MEVPGPWIEASPQQQPELLQWQLWVLNPLCHKETLVIFSTWFFSHGSLQNQSKCQISPKHWCYVRFFFFFFLGPHPRHIEVPRLGVKLELLLPAYPTITTMPVLGHICDLNCSSRQFGILNPLSKARDQTHIFIDPSWVCYCWATLGTPVTSDFKMGK